MLSCFIYGTEPTVGLGIYHGRPLPKDHPYFNKYDTYPVHLTLDGAVVASFENTVSFQPTKTSIDISNVPIYPFYKASKSGGKLAVKVDYPSELADVVKMEGYDLPSEGLATAVAALTKQCPQLAEQEKWKRNFMGDEWTFSQPTDVGDKNDFDISCSIYNKGTLTIHLKHRFGDLATKKRTVQDVDRTDKAQIFVTSGKEVLDRNKDGSFMDTPSFTSVFGLSAPAAKVLESVQQARPIMLGWGPEPTLAGVFGGSQIELPANGLSEALAHLRSKCPNLYK